MTQQEKKVLLKDNKTKIGLLIIFIISLIALFYLFNFDKFFTSNNCTALENKINNLIEEANYCKEDSDCLITSFGCPFGCYNLVNKDTDLKEIRENFLQEYGKKCSICKYKCPASRPTQQEIVCEQNKCVVSKSPDKSLCEKTGGELVDCFKALFAGCGTNSFMIDNKEYACACPEGKTWDSTLGCVEGFEATGNFREGKGISFCTLANNENINCRWFRVEDANKYNLSYIRELADRNSTVNVKGYIVTESLEDSCKRCQSGDVPCQAMYPSNCDGLTKDYLLIKEIEILGNNEMSGVSITTDKNQYQVGEDIKITIKYNLTMTQFLPLSVGVVKFTEGNWKTVNPEIRCANGGICAECKLDLTFIAPGDTRYMTWDQTVCDENATGAFKIILFAGENYYSNEFTITENKGVVISTDKTEYMIGESITATIKNNLEADISISSLCGVPGIPFEWFKYNGTEWNSFNAYLEKGCYVPPTKIGSSEEKEYALDPNEAQLFSKEDGKYKLLMRYSLWGQAGVGGVLPFVYSNEFLIRECSTNAECSFLNSTQRVPTIFGICLDGGCVQSCDPENYVVGCA